MRTIRITENDIRGLVAECVRKAATERPSWRNGHGIFGRALMENATERKRQEAAHNATVQVVREFFHNDDWLDREFIHQDNPEHMTSLDYMVFHFEEEFFHAPRPSKPIIRLEPMVAQLAFGFGFQQQNPDNQKLTELLHVVAYIEKQAKLGKLEIPKVAQMSPEQMFQTFGEAVRQEAEAMRSETESAEYGEMNQDYEILEDVDYETANEIGNMSCPGSKLCYTQSEDTWDSYTGGGYNTAYILLKKNFRDIPPEHNGVNEYDWLPENGYDEYGLSMIFVFVDGNGMITTSNTRWNHNATYGQGKSVDHALNEKDISNILGVNFYSVFKGNDKFRNKAEWAMETVRNGEDPKYVFDSYENLENGFAIVELDDKYNIIREDMTLVFPEQWFDSFGFFIGGFANVSIGDKCNLIGTDGQLLWKKPYEEWFDWCGNIVKGFARVYIDDKWNFVGTDGQLLWKKPYEEWFEYCGDFIEGFARVRSGNKWNFIGTDGQFLWKNPYKKWFDSCSNFNEEFAVVNIGGKYNYLGTDGRILSPNQWFDGCLCFNRGTGLVQIDGKWVNINSIGL